MTVRRTLGTALALLTAVALVAACGPGKNPGQSSGGAATTSTSASSPSSSSEPSDPHTGTVAPAPPAAASTSPPARVSVPSIGVDSALQSLGLLSDGTLQSPTQWQVAGWYSKGVIPGEPGPAVIAGHVDSVNGPAVFFRLKQINLGDHVTITQRDGHRQTWAVDDVQQYPKDRFPTDAVYGPTPGPVLRLVTCVGDFDYSKRSYLDNLVVSAHLV